jgi:hypothetical protein
LNKKIILILFYFLSCLILDLTELKTWDRICLNTLFDATTLSIMTLSIMTLSKMTLSIMTLSIMTLSTMTLSVMKLSLIFFITKEFAHILKRIHRLLIGMARLPCFG